MKLTAENYYSPEANWAYMSASQFKSFRSCESAALAELRGEWGRKDSIALLVGSFIDAYFSDEMEQFTAEHPEIYTAKGELKADFQKAMNAAQRLEQDDLCRMLLSGRHQVIKTGKIGGVWYKCKSDSLLSAAQVEAICKKFPEVRNIVPFGGPIIVDLKYMKDFEPIWDDEAHDKLPFIEFWGYDIQGGIYQKLDKRNAPFVIVAATKEAVPNIDSFYIPDDALSYCLDEVEEYSPRYAAIKRGEIEPIGCGTCAYCRSVKRVSSIKHYKLI
jgi:hypothetical protein